MSSNWSLEDVQETKPRPSPLFEDLKALADRWKSQPTGQYLSSTGQFESQADAEDLLARLNSIRRPDNAQEVLEAAVNFAKLDRATRSHELRKVLLPYELAPLSGPFTKR